MKLILINSEGHSSGLLDLTSFSNSLESRKEKISILGVIVDNFGNYLKYNFKFPSLGKIKSHHVWRDNVRCLIGVANLEYIKVFKEFFIQQGAKFLSYVHPSISILSIARIGQEVLKSPNVNLRSNTFVGDSLLVNSRANLGHNTKIEKFNFLIPNVSFFGSTEVKDENLFGINSETIVGVKIGDRNKIMAGMVLEENVRNGEVVFHRYKQTINVIKYDA